MTKFSKQIFSVLAAGVMVANVATPALASTTIEITGNGAGADNWATVNQTSNTTVSQNNTANVTNNVNADAKTGGNDANFNTGGDVTVNTGNAGVSADVTNVLNSNAADVNCCSTGNTNVTIADNGAFSNNGVTLNQGSTTSVGQNNVANVTNTVNADAKTGGNDANKNTGGDVTISTGKAVVDASVSTTANMNVAHVGSALGASNPSASFVIAGNGAGSDNYITAGLTKSTSVSQNNTANVTNDVDADASTGYNDAGFNTGGDQMIHTGDAVVRADVDNAVNFNAADVDCGCTWDVLAKIAGNGADTHFGNVADNIIDLTLGGTQAVGQGNVANLTNRLDELNAKTGGNDVELNTADVHGDPMISTGNAGVNSEVSNSGNVNSVGNLPFDMPEMPSNVEFSFNFAAFLAFFGMHN